MFALLIATIVITIVGASLLASMFVRDSSRLGLAGLSVLIAGEVVAMVYAVLEQQ